MSTALTVASVTAALRDLLNNGMIDQDVAGVIGGNVNVTALPPDRVEVTPPNATDQLNLFLYQVTPNSGWRNVGLPSRNDRGERLSNPPLALDLHYLLTAYGANELHAEILLGYGMQLMHEIPVLTRDSIRAALPNAMASLVSSGLADQVEQIKITPQSLSTEELSKLWSAFQAKYRPTTAYQVSVVLIQSRQSTKSAVPVRYRSVRAIPFKQPIIEKVLSQKKSGDPILDQPILAGYNLVILGKQLSADAAEVSINGVKEKVVATNDTQLIHALPGTLTAGVHGVQVVHRVMLGLPNEETEHRGVESNVAAFVLRPQIIVPIMISNIQGTGNNPRSATLELTVDPPVSETQRVVLLLNELIPQLSPPDAEVISRSYSFTADKFSTSPPSSPPAVSNKITVKIKDVAAATYLARIQVDGAESLLGPESGQYSAPSITIP